MQSQIKQVKQGIISLLYRIKTTNLIEVHSGIAASIGQKVYGEWEDGEIMSIEL